MSKHLRKSISFTLIVAFVSSSLYIPKAQAGEMVMLRLPVPGVMVHLSPEYTPAHLQGLTIHPENALQFDFLVHKGDGQLDSDQKRQEYTKLVKYFLASLTIPDADQWVNLSPYEHNRIIKDDFGKTEMGRDLLSQDYLLKQITSSLMYPESGLGKAFWDKVYERAYKEYGTTNVPVNTFNKVWIIPDEAAVYESGNTVYILRNHLKAMLEEDYLSLQKHSAIVIASEAKQSNTHTIASKIVKEIILPELEREVNEGKNFAMLRQIFSGMILATWYKHALKESLLGQVYANKAKVAGISVIARSEATKQSQQNLSFPNASVGNPDTVESIYQKYLKAFKKGVFNYIKEDADKYSQQIIPRKYFAGGFENNLNQAMTVVNAATITMDQAELAVRQNMQDIDRAKVNILAAGDKQDRAMTYDSLPTKEEVQAQVNLIIRQYKDQGNLEIGLQINDQIGDPLIQLASNLSMHNDNVNAKKALILAQQVLTLARQLNPHDMEILANLAYTAVKAGVPSGKYLLREAMWGISILFKQPDLDISLLERLGIVRDTLILTANNYHIDLRAPTGGEAYKAGLDRLYDLYDIAEHTFKEGYIIGGKEDEMGLLGASITLVNEAEGVMGYLNSGLADMLVRQGIKSRGRNMTKEDLLNSVNQYREDGRKYLLTIAEYMNTQLTPQDSNALWSNIESTLRELPEDFQGTVDEFMKLKQTPSNPAMVTSKLPPGAAMTVEKAKKMVEDALRELKKDLVPEGLDPRLYNLENEFKLFKDLTGIPEVLEQLTQLIKQYRSRPSTFYGEAVKNKIIEKLSSVNRQISEARYMEMRMSEFAPAVSSPSLNSTPLSLSERFRLWAQTKKKQLKDKFNTGNESSTTDAAMMTGNGLLNTRPLRTIRGILRTGVGRTDNNSKRSSEHTPTHYDWFPIDYSKNLGSYYVAGHEDLDRIISLADRSRRAQGREKNIIISVGSGSSFNEYLLAKTKKASVVAVDQDEGRIRAAAREFGLPEIIPGVFSNHDLNADFDLTLIISRNLDMVDKINSLGWVHIAKMSEPIRQKEAELAGLLNKYVTADMDVGAMTRMASSIRKQYQDIERLKAEFWETHTSTVDLVFNSWMEPMHDYTESLRDLGAPYIILISSGIVSDRTGILSTKSLREMATAGVVKGTYTGALTEHGYQKQGEPIEVGGGGSFMHVFLRDRALLSHKSIENPGGIDLNAANLNLQIKRDGRGVPLPLLQQDWAKLNQIQGFIPTIIEIRPVTTLPILSELQQKLRAS